MIFFCLKYLTFEHRAFRRE